MPADRKEKKEMEMEKTKARELNAHINTRANIKSDLNFQMKSQRTEMGLPMMPSPGALTPQPESALDRLQAIQGIVEKAR